MKNILILTALTLTLTACGEQIDSGHRGVRTSFGEVQPESLPEGFYWYSPVGGNILEIDVRQQTTTGDTTAYTKDVQQANLSYSVSFIPNPAQVPAIYQTVGLDWPSRLITDVLLDSLKSVVGKWDATDLIANRDKVAPQVLDVLQARISLRAKALGLPADVVTVTQFAVTNIDYSDEFEKAVEAKMVATQAAEQAKNQTVRVEEEAKQRVITAKAEAEAMQIKAQALTSNPALVGYEAVQKWDGKLPYYSGSPSPMPFVKVGE